jgi:hypothetical protein
MNQSIISFYCFVISYNFLNVCRKLSHYTNYCPNYHIRGMIVIKF